MPADPPGASSGVTSGPTDPAADSAVADVAPTKPVVRNRNRKKPSRAAELLRQAMPTAAEAAASAEGKGLSYGASASTETTAPSASVSDDVAAVPEEKVERVVPEPAPRPAPTTPPPPFAPVIEAEPELETAAAPVAVEPTPTGSSRSAAPRGKMGYRERREALRFRARKVRRLIRHVDPWSVLKMSLAFFTCMWLIVMIAGTMLWSVAATTGTIDDIESFVDELGVAEDFQFEADVIFRNTALLGIIVTLALSGMMVIGAVIFNLISDLTGGVWVTVIEEETARPVAQRGRDPG